MSDEQTRDEPLADDADDDVSDDDFDDATEIVESTDDGILDDTFLDDLLPESDEDEDEDDEESAPPSRTWRRPRRKLRARRVERIVRRIDPWSAMKFSFLFLVCLYVIFMLAGILLWSAAVQSGAIDNVENFITELFALKSFEFDGEQIFQAVSVGGAIMVLVGTAFSVLLSVLFNLISDLTGGVRASVIELENVREL